jgi:hypothetical protein
MDGAVVVMVTMMTDGYGYWEERQLQALAWNASAALLVRPG